MDFFERHYEKLILAICMLCMIVTVKMVADRKYHAAARNSSQETKRAMTITAKNEVPALDAKKLIPLSQMLDSRRSDIEILRSPNGNDGAGHALPALFDPGQYIVCKKADCGYILPYIFDKCPRCGTEQEKVGREPRPEDDLDRDGIPDIFEKKHAAEHVDDKGKTLNYRNPFDARDDFDGDGFLNIEEYRAGTDMNDAAKRPPLAYLLRHEGEAKQQMLPFTLFQIKTLDEPDKAAWRAEFQPMNGPRGARRITARLKQPNILGGYTLVDFSSDGKSVTVKSPTGDEYTISDKKPVKQKAYSALLVFLASHARHAEPITFTPAQMAPGGNRSAGRPAGPPRRGAPGRGGAGPVGMDDLDGEDLGTRESSAQIHFFSIPSGFVFELTMNAGENGGEIHEFYRLQPISEATTRQIFVQQLSGPNGAPVGQPIQVRQLDRENDFIPELDGNRRDGEPGDEGMDGMPRRGRRARRVRGLPR